MNRHFLVVLYDKGGNDLLGEMIEAADRNEALNKFVNRMSIFCIIKAQTLEASYMKVFEFGVA